MIRRTTRAVGIAVSMLALSVASAYAADGIDSVVPNDCVMFVRVKSPEAFGQEFQKTAVWRALASTELVDAGVDALSGSARFLCAAVTGVPLRTVTQHFFNDVGIAVFELGPDPKRKPPMVLLCDVSEDPAQAKSLLEGTALARLRSINKKLSVSTDTHGGVTITKLQERGKDPGYWAFVDGVFAIGDIKAVRKIIDTSKSPGESLAGFEPYCAAMRHVAVDVGAMSYINTQMLVDRIRPLLPGRPKQKNGLMLTGVLGMKALAASADVQGEGVRNRVYVFTGEDKMGLLHLATAEPGGELKAPRLVPEDHHVYVAANMGSGAALHSAFRAILLEMVGDAKYAEMVQFAQHFEQQIGIIWQADFIDALAGEVFFAMRMPNLAELATSRRKPGPQDFGILIGFTVTDEDALKTSINSLLQSEFAVNQGFTVNTQTYKEREIFVLALPGNARVSPCYTFEGGCFVFALFPETLERFLDRAADNRSISTTDRHEKCVAQVSGHGNVVVYADAAGVLRSALELAEVKAPPPIQSFMPEIKKVANAVSGAAIAIKGEADGISAQSYGSIGAPFALTTLAGLGNLTKSDQGRRVQTAKGRMKKVRELLERHYAQNRAYPETLEAFVGKKEESIFFDPFREDVYFGYAQVGGPGERGWILVSVGPDRQLDIDLSVWSPAEWQAKLMSTDPSVIMEMKRQVFQFQKKRHRDEKAEDDEGDIVLTRP